MAHTPYTKETWGDGTTAITAARLQNIEDGIEANDQRIDAAATRVYFGRVSSAGAFQVTPTGMSVSKQGTGHYRVTHGLATGSYVAFLQSVFTGRRFVYHSQTSTYVDVFTEDDSGTRVDTSFAFLLIDHS